MSSQVKSYTHLKDRPHGDKALQLLQRIASLVKPIMRARGWVLPVLSEFFPSDPGLLGMNVNHGQKIYIRLRPARRSDSFYEEEALVGTMLHELTHNVHGPHDDKFYKYLSELEDEYYKLRANGYSGEGFDAPGKRLGQGVAHNVPWHQAKSQAALAAEKRARAAGIMGPAGGRKLGGVPTRIGAKTPRELSAAAAERRARDEKTCGSISEDIIQRETERAIAESILDIPDIDVPPSPPLSASTSTALLEQGILDIPDIDVPPSPSLPASTSTALPVSTKRPLSSPERAATDPSPSKRPRGNGVLPSGNAVAARLRKQAGTEHMSGHIDTATATRPPRSKPSSAWGWDCKVCTLVNGQLALTCEACGTTKPVDPSIGWTCLGCGEVGNAVEWWTCKGCGRMKSEAAGG